MAKKALLFSLDEVDLSAVHWDKQEILRRNPQRYEFEMLDGMIHIDPVTVRAVAFKDLAADAWWTRGHIPGRPLMPGVLMIEAAAQMASCLSKLVYPDVGFIGFTGVDAVKFRGQVVPPGRLLLLMQAQSVKPRRIVVSSQAIYQDEVVFEGQITGMPF